MELVPSGNSRKNGSQSNGAVIENDEDKDKAMAATYAAYTKRARMHAEKVKAQQLSRQLKTRLQFARLKVDYGWTRQSLNEVENLYFHLSRARPAPQPPLVRSDVPAEEEQRAAGPSTPPTAAPTPIQTSLDTPPASQTTQSTEIETPLFPLSQTQSLPNLSVPPTPVPFLPSSQPTVPQPTPAPGPRRSPYMERTRTGGLVRPAPPVERLRTGGKVKPTSTTLSPKKRGRPRIPDESEPVAPAASVSTTTEGTLTYDSFWSSLGSLKTPGS